MLNSFIALVLHMKSTLFHGSSCKLQNVGSVMYDCIYGILPPIGEEFIHRSGSQILESAGH